MTGSARAKNRKKVYIVLCNGELAHSFNFFNFFIGLVGLYPGLGKTGMAKLRPA